MKETVSLDELRPGQCAVVRCLKCTGAMRRRLLDIGLIENTRLECLGISPMGDPKAFCIRGAVIALRAEDCRNICVCRTV